MRALFSVLLAVTMAALTACSGSRTTEPEWLPNSADARADYALFAVRCSKCHSLARPLNSGIDDDYYWKMYVARMRRQPGSGISLEDTVGILRFLHVYSLEQRRKKNEPPVVDVPPAPPSEPDATSPASSASSPSSPSSPAAPQ